MRIQGLLLASVLMVTLPAWTRALAENHSTAANGRAVVAPPWDCNVDDELVRAAILSEAQILHAKLFIEANRLKGEIGRITATQPNGNPVRIELTQRAEQLAKLIGWHDWSISGHTIDPKDFFADSQASSNRMLLSAPVAVLPIAVTQGNFFAYLSHPRRAFRVPARSYSGLALAWSGWASSGDDLLNAALLKMPNKILPQHERMLQEKIDSGIKSQISELAPVLNWSPANQQKVMQRLMHRMLTEAVRVVTTSRDMRELKVGVVLEKFKDIDLIEFFETETKQDPTFPVSADQLNGLKEMQRIHLLTYGMANDKPNDRWSHHRQHADNLETLADKSGDKQTAIKNARAVLSFYQALQNIYALRPKAGEEYIFNCVKIAIDSIRAICNSPSAFRETNP